MSEPFEITERVGPVLIRAEVTPGAKLRSTITFMYQTVKNVWLTRCSSAPLDEIEIDENLRFVEEPLEDRELDLKNLKAKKNPLVKVLGTTLAMS
ncbi:hypothetical protein Tco_0250638 [Tanacetum coccineum]